MATIREIKNVPNNIKHELETIVEKITTTIVVTKIILFGSHARGTAQSTSDIDLCIITEDKRRKIEIIWAIQKAVYQAAKHPLDILVYRPEEFLNRSDSISTIEKTINGKGVVLYG